MNPSPVSIRGAGPQDWAFIHALVAQHFTGLVAESALCHWLCHESHRVEKIGEKNGITFIDDSKGTNVGATEAAIAGLQSPLVLIAGGQGKGQDFTPLGEALRNKARAVLLIGADAAKIEADLQGFGLKLLHCATLEEATRRAYEIAQSGDIVLLSPACASFDMFEGYAHRAEVFANAFHAL